VIADGHALPLRDAAVAAVLLMEVLEHVSDPARLLGECARVLIPGGHVCLTAPQYHITHNHPGDYFRYTRQGLEALCARAGLSVVAAWATGGPLLVVFHAVELNLPPRPRLAFVGLTYRLFDWLDGRLTGHGNRPGAIDAKGWALLAVKR
jgi:SAM-dependent methyltransferase